MRLFNDVAVPLQKYYVTRDFNFLHEAMGIIAKEIESPALQEHTITVPYSVEAVEQAIQAEGFLNLPMAGACDSSGPIESGKLVRVVSQEEDSEVGCMILNVAHIDDEVIILVAPGGVA